MVAVSQTILAIHAHPDDCEILAGGTLARLSSLGHDVVIVSMTPGDCGSHEHGAEEIAELRRQEATRAAQLISARYRCAEFRDLAIFNDDRSRRWVVEILRQIRPAVVITASPVDYMCDHEATSVLVRDACFAAPAPNYATRFDSPSPHLDAIPHLYFMDPVGGVDHENRPIPADFFVDVSAVMAVKRDLLAEHASQRDWLLRHHGMDDYLLQMEEWSRRRGAAAGVAFAEGMRQYKGHPYPQTPLLQKLLGAVLGDAAQS
jgi:LmbE family N-acetylglucosaminyl deacetylase